MPTTAAELMTSRTSALGGSAKHEKIYTVTGSASENDIATAALAAAPVSFGGTGTVFPWMTRDSVEVAPVMVDEGNAAACRWTATVSYKPLVPGGQTGNEPVFQFDSTGGTKHTTISRETLQTAGVFVGPPPHNIPDYHRMIGISRENGGAARIDGVSVVAPSFNFKETVYLAPAVVDTAYKLSLADATGTVNDDTFRGFEAGEVLYLGSTGQRQGNDLWQITHNFAVQRNRASVEVGDEITFTDVGGWEYVWAEYVDEHDTDAKVTIKKPKFAYVERVYEAADFEALFGA